MSQSSGFTISTINSQSSEEELSKVVIDVDAKEDTSTIIGDNCLLSYNVPEKVIIVLDRAHDEDCTSFELASNKKYSPLSMLQHALKLFLHNKSEINPEHQFAIIQLDEYSATWIHDFTNSVQDILASTQTITDLPCETEDIFDLNKVFDIIIDKLRLSSLSYSTSTPPNYVVHIILLYGRSYALPELNRTSEVEKLLGSPYCTVDVVMTHEPPDSSNKCEEIFKRLQKIDMKGSSYSFSVSRNASDLHCAMAKILSHPLQRPHKTNANYNLNSIVTS